MKKIIWIKYFFKSKFNIFLNKVDLNRFVKHKYKLEILDRYDTNQLIKKWILDGKPRMIARYGSNEAYITAETIGINLRVKKGLERNRYYLYTEMQGYFHMVKKLQLNSGIL